MSKQCKRRVLLIKTSSLGDIVHAMTALTDAVLHAPDVCFDWLVDESLVDLPALHSAVDRVIPVAFRRWRRHPLRFLRSGDYQNLRIALADRRYDAIIDAQGLLKSALLSRLAEGPRYGLDWRSVREPLASLVYHRRFRIAKDTHAVLALRQLFSRVLGYAMPVTEPALHVDHTRLPIPSPESPYVVFLHGTQWPTKHWPERYWIELAHLVQDTGFDLWLPAKSKAEGRRADVIAGDCAKARVLPPSALTEVVGVLAAARGVVGVDTGLAHLSAALGIPTVVLFGPTSPLRTGAVGRYHRNLSATLPCAPCLSRHCRYQGPSEVTPACFQSLSPTHVFGELTSLIAERSAT
ncbi:MAG: lipopolysaccharide heptosyltransferase I [Gammaproteobacteria bacterium]